MNKDSITQQGMEQMLQESKELFRNILDHAPFGIATVSIDGQFMQINQALCLITGYEKEELENLNYKKLTYAEDLPIDAFNVQQLLQGKVESYRLEKRYVRKDSKVIWVQVTRSLLRNPDTQKPLYFIAQVEDITERKQSEKARQESEERLRNVMDNAPVGITTVSLDGQFIQVNQALCAITGYQQEELVSMNYKKLTYAEDLSIDADNVRQLLEGKINFYRLEKRYIRKDGRIIWVQVTRSLLRDVATGTPLYFIAQVEDITERKQIEKTLRENEERFHNIMDNAPVGIAAVSLEGQFIQVNRALGRITGYKPEELQCLTYQEITYPEDLPANIIKVQQLLEGKITSYQMEKRYICKDNKIIWVQVTRSLLRDEITSAPLYFIAQVENITERKLAEEKLRKSAEEIADLYDNAPCGYHSLDANGVFVRMNTTELQWLGYMRDEVIGKMKFSDLLTPTSLRIFQENASEFNKQGFMYDLEVEMLRKDGSTFIVLLNATGNKTYGDRYVMSRSTMFNITERKRTERALQESEERFRNIMDNAPIGMAMQSLEGKFLQVNRALCEILGYTKEELEKLTFQKMTYPEDLVIERDKMQQLLEGKIRSYQIEKRGIRKNGTITWTQVTRSILRDTITGEPSYLIVQVEDINSRKRDQEKIHQLAYHDVLTGLPNRQFLLERLEQAIAQAKRHQRLLAIMFVDLDKFKQINDTLGHHIGDELLKEIAIRFSSSVRKGDVVARTGGDEFIVVLTEVASPQDVILVADKMIQKVNLPIVIQNHSLQIAASIGMAVYPFNGSDANELMKKADMAMYMAKEAGGNQYHFS